jgi:hypothetical protein
MAGSLIRICASARRLGPTLGGSTEQLSDRATELANTTSKSSSRRQWHFFLVLSLPLSPSPSGGRHNGTRKGPSRTVVGAAGHRTIGPIWTTVHHSHAVRVLRHELERQTGRLLCVHGHLFVQRQHFATSAMLLAARHENKNAASSSPRHSLVGSGHPPAVSKWPTNFRPLESDHQ